MLKSLGQCHYFTCYRIVKLLKIVISSHLMLFRWMKQCVIKEWSDYLQIYSLMQTLGMFPYGLFTWKGGGASGRWANLLRWDSLAVHIISHFNLITCTFSTLQVGWPAKAGVENRVNMSGRVKFCHVNVSKWSKPCTWGRICYKWYSCKIHFGSYFAS